MALTAIKDNKVYTVSDVDKDSYVAAGFDIYNDAGEVVEYGKGKTVSMDAFLALEAENKALKAELEALTEMKNSEKAKTNKK